jgi:uncharacterized protein YggE
MAKPQRVTVSGTGEVQVEPDRAELHFNLQAVESDRQRAHDLIARRLAAVNEILDRNSVSPERRRSGPVLERQLFQPNSRRSRGFEASARLTVRLASFEKLGTLIDEAVSRAEANVAGPIWSLSADHPSQLEACRRASEAAGRRARAFAEGAGLGLGPLVRLTESAAVVPERMLRSIVRGAPPPPPEIELSPGELTVSAQVTAVYELRPDEGEASLAPT